MSFRVKLLVMLAAFILVLSMSELVSAMVPNMLLGGERSGEAQTCYQESFGTRSGIQYCSAHDSKTWQDPQDTKLLIRCPQEGVINGQIVFAEMESCITSTEHRLNIVDGGIGLNFIILQLEVNKTKLLDYTAKFYVK